MKFGVTVSRFDEIDLAVEAENSGYDLCCVCDSPLVRSNLWGMMTLAAERT